MSEPTLASAAREYIARGWSILPLHRVGPDGLTCSCSKGRNCLSKGKHPMIDWRNWGGMTDAQIEETWGPGAVRPPNLGILTGRRSGIFVVDFDPKSGGDAVFAQMRDHGLIDETYAVRTGSGGWHLYYLMPPDFEPTNSTKRLWEFLGITGGVDIRAEGGLVVAPPSRTDKGPYEACMFDDPGPAPAGLLDLIRPVESETSNTSTYAGVVGELAWNQKAYINTAIDAELARLAECVAATRPSMDGYGGPPWNITSSETAMSIIELANAGGMPLDRAHQLWYQATPTDPGFDSDVKATIWTSAMARCSGKARTLPEPKIDNPLQTDYELMMELVGKSAEKKALEPRKEEQTAPGPVAGTEEWAQQRLDKLRAELLSSSDLDKLPALRPLIRDYLYLDTLGRVNGKSGHGKSFVMLDMAGCIGSGIDWQGNKTAKGLVIYLVAEGGHGIRKRVRAWEKHYGRTMEGVKFLPRPLQIQSTEWTDLTIVCQELRPSLIILDTQARLTVGVEENSAKEMGEVIARMDDLRAATGACVSAVHHLGLSGEHGRGSTAVQAALQSELLIEKEDKIIKISFAKQKDDEEAEPLGLLMQQVDIGEIDEDGMPVTSVVLVKPATSVLDTIVEVDSSTTWAHQLKSLMSTTFSQGEGYTAAQIEREFCKTAKCSRRSFYRAWGEGQEEGWIRRSGSKYAYAGGLPGEARTEPATGSMFGMPDPEPGDKY